MNRLFIAAMITAGTLIAAKGQSQVYINAHVGLGYPVRRMYYAPPPPPPVVYQEDAYAPAPVYETPACQAPPPCYDAYGRVVIVDRGWHGRGYYHEGFDRDRYYDRHEERFHERHRYDDEGRYGRRY